MDYEPGGCFAHGQGATQRDAHQVFGYGLVRLPADFACAMVELDGQVEPAVALSGQAPNIVHSHPIWGCGSRLSEQAFGRGTPGRVEVGGVRHDRVGLLLPQAVRVELAADAPAASRVAVGLYFDLLLAGIVALVLVR